MKWVFVAPVVMTGAFLFASPALCSPTEIGMSVDVIHGTHTERTAGARAPAIPVPMFSASHRMGRLEIEAEGIPPLGRVPVRNNGLGLNGIALTYLSGAIRYHFAWTTIGLAETVYNQETTYLYSNSYPPPIPAVSLVSSTETDRSRVVGLQYELLQTLHRTGRSQLDVHFGYNPHMTASLGQQISFNFSNGVSRLTKWVAIPEAGSQIDTSLSSRVTTRRMTVQYGIRYLNLVMRFSDGTLADRNAFLVPFIGVSTSVGH